MSNIQLVRKGILTFTLPIKYELFLTIFTRAKQPKLIMLLPIHFLWPVKIQPSPTLIPQGPGKQTRFHSPSHFRCHAEEDPDRPPPPAQTAPAAVPTEAKSVTKNLRLRPRWRRGQE